MEPYEKEINSLRIAMHDRLKNNSVTWEYYYIKLHKLITRLTGINNFNNAFDFLADVKKYNI